MPAPMLAAVAPLFAKAGTAAAAKAGTATAAKMGTTAATKAGTTAAGKAATGGTKANVARLSRVLAQNLDRDEEEEDKYTGADALRDRLSPLAERLKSQRAPTPANIPGTSSSWDQFDALIKGRGLDF